MVAVSTSHAADRRSSAPGVHADADLVVDRHGAVTHWSRAAHDLLGFTAAEMRGRPVSGLLAPEQPVALGGGPDGRDLTAPVVLRCRDGHTEPCRVRIRPAGHAPGSWTVQVTAAADESEAQVVDEAVLNALFTQSPTSLCVYGSDLRLRRFNPAAEGMQGVFAAGSLGLMPHELWPDSNSDEFEERMQDVLESGVPVVNFDKRGRPPDDPEHEHIHANSIFRLEDPGGRVVGLATTAVEITERRTAEERIALLADASALIGTSLDVVETGQQLAAVAVPRFADATAVDVFAPVIAGEEPDPARDDLLRTGLRYVPAAACGEGPAPAGQPRFPYPVSAGGRLTDVEPRRVEIMLPGDDGEPLYRGTTGLRPAHSLVVPMKARGVVLGVVTFYRLGLSSPFSDFDVLTARDLATRAALSFDNARRYTREHIAARAMQRELLPQHVAPQSAVQTADHFVPAGSGANWFDVIPLSGARVALVVGTTDEAGLSGAAAIGRLAAAVHTLADLDLDPEEVLARLDSLVVRIAGEQRAGTAPRDDGTGAEITCVYAVYDPATGRLTLAGAGHAPPVVARPDGSVQALTGAVGAPLGTSDRERSSQEVELPADSTLLFYAPAVTADGRPTREAPQWLTRAMASSSDAFLEQLRNEVVKASPPNEASRRGSVLLLARTQRLDDDRMSTWDLPSDPAVVATARSLVQRQLEVWGLEETAFVTELVVSELVTNAIRHAEGPVRLRVIRDQDALICEVSDASTTAPHLRHARSGDEGGRGLFLVAQLTRRWGTRFSGTGKTIWTEQGVEGDVRP
ncbi:hypothetical protein ADL00_11445 [Streptomyces sp. AS58]|nr:hypothetical protein ADL00_11445 [Streptomyces sp. AS58]